MNIFAFIRNILEYVFGTPGGKLVTQQNAEHSVIITTIYPFDEKDEFDQTQSNSNQDLFVVACMEAPYGCILKKLSWYEYKNESSLFFCLNTENCFLSKSSQYSQMRENLIFIRSEKNISGAREYFLHIRNRVEFDISEFEKVCADVLASSLVNRFAYSSQPRSDIITIFYSIKIPLRNVLAMEFLFQK